MKIGQYMRQFSVVLALLFLQTIVFSILSLFLTEEWKEQRFPEEMKVAGITIGGLTYVEAQRRLEDVIYTIDHIPLQVTIGDRVFPIDKKAINLSYDMDATMKKAQAVSRERTMAGLWQKWQGDAPPLGISFYVTYDEKALEAIITRISRNVGQQDSKRMAEGGAVEVAAARKDMQVDVPRTVKAIDEELRMFNQHLRVPLVLLREKSGTNRAVTRNALISALRNIQ
ncbi:putative peptidoglycan binding protein [Aneurinibacillus soli]|uniref:Putative peptidoglycan binding domain protein n=1 Tax=Aneurinibacillus soli TaxID=1500254 RepID=A0A0U4NLM0_9BACL|nr:peptidoglycan binding domain-containing protein [Aneurinibacillus soli]PYE59136.1 putative peptidoglycan binding protein [Aneurinibacillus soli]BAU29556.1 putative peptidoglycan binding domain protein [Aneurinibacillus soli]